jgi:hypothetical protein
MLQYSSRQAEFKAHCYVSQSKERRFYIYKKWLGDFVSTNLEDSFLKNIYLCVVYTHLLIAYSILVIFGFTTMKEKNTQQTCVCGQSQ